MVKRLKYFTIIALTIVCLVFPKNNAKAACTFTGSGGWGKDPAIITLNDNISYGLSGNQECANKDVIIEVYGKGGIDFRINTIATTANSSGTVSTTISFNTSDFSGRSGDQTVYLKIKAEDGSSNQVNSPNLTVKLSAGGSCTLTSTKWSWLFSAHPIIGSPLHMVVNGSGCAGYTVSFAIYSSEIIQNRAITTVSGTFDSTGTKLDKVWVVDTSNDTRILSSRIGDYHIYFYASAGSSKVTSDTILIPTNSQQGCLNCNAVLAPDTVECSDGSSVQRGPAKDAPSACKDHIGDAHTDSPGAGSGGTKYSCNSTNTACVPDTGGAYTNNYCDYKCVAATSDKTYTFNITNPLNGGPNDLFDIINIVTQWIMYISVPLAVLWIMYAGFLMLTAGPKPENFNKGRDILKYTILGLAIIFIGKGFVSLIISVIQLGGTGTSTTQTQNTNSGTNTNPTTQSGATEPAGSLPSGTIIYGCTDQGYCVSSDDPNIYKNYRQLSTDPSCSNACNSGGPDGSVGSLCQKTGDCQSGYECKNNMCQQTSGNFINDPCVKNNNCRNGATCNLVNFQVKDGIKLGTCE